MFEYINELGHNREPFFFLVDYEKSNIQAFPLSSLPSDVHFQLDGFGSAPIPKTVSSCHMSNIEPVPKQQYAQAFETVKEQMQAGNTYLLNLTFPTSVQLDCNLLELYGALNAKFTCYFQNKFICFSPERFVRVEGSTIKAYPMKGTSLLCEDTTGDNLLHSDKEAAEHLMIVDLLRNDLNRVAKDITVNKFRYLEKIATNKGWLWQTSSEIAGRLEPDWHCKIGDILQSLLPAGSISGTPKPRTCDIIKAVEKEPRGYFSGVFGYFDGKNLDSAVIIRYIEKEKDRFFYRSGGGLTIDSTVEQEYSEMFSKVYLPTDNSPISSRIGHQTLFFETIKLINGTLQNLDYHSARLHKTRRELWGGTDQLDLPELLRSVPQKGSFRVRVTYNEKIQQVEVFPLALKPIHTLMVMVSGINYAYKYFDRTQLDDLYSQKGEADDILIVNKQGLVTDTSIANLCFFDGQQWFTPATPLLPGTYRARLLDLGAIKEKTIQLEDIAHYKHVAIINSLRGMQVVKRVIFSGKG